MQLARLLEGGLSDSQNTACVPAHLKRELENSPNRRFAAFGFGRLFVAVLLVVSLAGCPAGDTDQKTSDGGVSKKNPLHEEEDPAYLPPPLLKDWSAPKVALVLSGEQIGYLEPCGCSETQSGGMSRRANLFKQIHERGWATAAFDLGSLVRRNRRQSKIKFESMLSCLSDMDYSVVGIGPQEIALGADTFLQLHNPEPEKPNTTPQFVSANITVYGGEDLGHLPYKVITVNDTAIGVTSVITPSISETVVGLNPNPNADIAITPAKEKLPAVLEKMAAHGPAPELIVLMTQSSLIEAREIAQQYPQVNLILSTGGAEDPLPEAEMVGKTMLINVGHKGKSVGVVGYYPDNEKQPLRFELVNLDKYRFPDTERMREQMMYYQDRLKEEELATKEPPIPHPTGDTFVGAKQCARCHTKAYEKWKTSKHANAFPSLTRGRKGQEENWIPRKHDPECLACHVTGWHTRQVVRYDSGYIDEKTTPDLLGNQCENCHGPGSKHVELENRWKKDKDSVPVEELAATRKQLTLTKDKAKKITCGLCHDLDNSPHFDFEKYWPEVEHPWRD